jgi:cell division protein FtsB
MALVRSFKTVLQAPFKGRVFIALFVCTNILFLFLQIYKQNVLIQLSYTEQRLKKEHGNLSRQRDTLKQEYAQLTSPGYIKNAATRKKMRPIRLNQIQKISIS